HREDHVRAGHRGGIAVRRERLHDRSGDYRILHRGAGAALLSAAARHDRNARKEKQKPGQGPERSAHVTSSPRNLDPGSKQATLLPGYGKASINAARVRRRSASDRKNRDPAGKAHRVILPLSEKVGRVRNRGGGSGREPRTALQALRPGFR